MLARNLDAYLALVADMLVRPTFSAAELDRTRREVIGQIDELRNDDRALAARFFARNLYADHPYGHPPDGIAAALEAARPDEVSAHFRRHFVGKNLVFAFSGDVDADALAASLKRAFRRPSARGRAPEPNALELREPVPPKGWRIQLVDKPDRQQTQLLFGHPARARDRSGLPAAHARADGVRRPRHERDDDERDPPQARPRLRRLPDAGRRAGASAPATGWVFSGSDKTVTTLKLVLKLYVAFMEKGLSARGRRVLQALPDRLARVGHGRARTPAGRPRDRRDRRPARGLRRHLSRADRRADARRVNAAIKRRVHARDLAITMVATASVMKKLLVDAKVQESAIDVVPYDGY